MKKQIINKNTNDGQTEQITKKAMHLHRFFCCSVFTLSQRGTTETLEKRGVILCKKRSETSNLFYCTGVVDLDGHGEIAAVPEKGKR